MSKEPIRLERSGRFFLSLNKSYIDKPFWSGVLEDRITGTQHKLPETFSRAELITIAKLAAIDIMEGRPVRDRSDN